MTADGGTPSGAPVPTGRLTIIHLLKHAMRGNGSVHVAVDLACAQADAGHTVYFASSRGAYDDLLRAHNVNVTPLPESSGVGGALRNEWSLMRLVRRVRPDILHAHMMSSTVLAYPVAKLSRSVLVTTVHNSFDSHSRLMRLGTLIVAVSEAERALLLSRGFSARRVKTVLNGSVNSPREVLPFEDIGQLRNPCIMTLSGLHPRKGVDDVISAFALVAEEFPNWSLEIIGNGPAREALTQQVMDLGLDERVRLPGSTITPWPLLKQAAVFATGTSADPFGLAIAEARAAGCAIVATDVGGVPEVVEYGRAGQLVPVHDPEAMAAAFRSLLGDPDLLASWQERARAGSEVFSVTRMQKDYDVAYRTVFARR